MQKGFNPSSFARFFLVKNYAVRFVMRATCLIVAFTFVFVCLLFANRGYGQDLDQTIRFVIKNAGIKESILLIEKESGIHFLMRDDLIKNNEKRLSFSFPRITVRQALERVLVNTHLTYIEVDGFVSLVDKTAQLQVAGKVIDETTREPLPGVNIRVKGTNSPVFTDADGNFSIRIPAYGVALQFQCVGYRMAEIKVSNAGSVRNVAMKTLSTALREVKVSARRRANTEVAVLEERRLSAIVQDAISAQQIERTASITTTQALQRVTGVTVTDEKYVAIRGLGERSVIGQLNGVRLASSDPDRSSIPLDLVPASLLDNITVFKTVTPDKPADAASGIIELKTKSVPDSLTIEIIAQSGFNSNIGIGGNYNSFYNSDMGAWGAKINDKNLRQDFLNLAKEYPNGMGSVQQMIANSQYSQAAWTETARINSIMQSFDPALTTGYKKAPLNQLYSATFGNRYKVFKKHQVGVILGGNYYRRITDINNGELTQYSIYQGVVTGNNHIYSFRNIPNYITPNRLYMGKYQTYKENTGTETLNYGMLGGLTYRFNPKHEVSLQYLGSWGGENKGVNMFGGYQYTGLPGEVSSNIYSLKQSYRTLNTYNLQGEHEFFSGEYAPRLSYNIATSSSSQNDPDYRFASLAVYKPRERVSIQFPESAYPLYPVNPSLYSFENLYVLTSGYVNGFGVYGTIQADPNGRRWRKLEETNYNYKADISIPFPLFGQKQEFKTGFNYLNRDRSFTENLLFLPGSNYTDYKNIPLYVVGGNLDKLIGPGIVGVQATRPEQREGSAPIGGFLYNSQKSPNNYIGFYETNAYYGMLDLHINKNLRIVGGVRFEKTDIRSAVDTSGIFLDPALTGLSEDGGRVPLVFIEPNSVYTTKYKPYYSLNVTYSIREKMNLRSAFNTTLARPELREITNVFEFDAFQMGLVVGNPNLKNQHTENLDFRWEWFPNRGEVLAFSAFGKRIKNQLVRVFDLKTQGLAATYPEYPTIRFQNDHNVGYVWGIEMEVVKDLATVSHFLKRFSIGTNLTLAQSQIKKSKERYMANMSLDRNTPEDSPLFEQAPYSLNGWLNFTHKKWGTDLTTTFNMVGERLIQINLTGEPDLYTRPVPMLDFVFSQRIARKVIFKGYAKNILNPDIKTVYSSYNTGGTWYGNEYINRSYKRGAEIMMGFTYNFF